MSASVLIVGTSPASADEACATSFTKQLAGTVRGEDGRFVSAQVGIELFDAAGRKLDMAGCVTTAGGYPRSAHVNVKPANPPCCYILPGGGSVASTFNGYQLSNDWSMTDIPDNAVTAWIEVYPKRAGGSPNTDDSRYGRALRRPVPLSSTNIDVKLPLRCGLSESGVTGSTGSIQGQVFDGGVVAQATRVGAWSTGTDDGQTILGWSLHNPTTTTFDVEPLAPGTYSVIASANGVSRQIYGVQVLPCHITRVNVAVRGVAPAPPAIDRPLAGDWDGDGDDEPATFTPGGTWHLRSGSELSATADQTFTYGKAAGDRPVAGDWDGDGIDDVGVFRAGGGWFLRSSATGTTVQTFTYGKAAGDVPVVGDWDGDGDDDMGVYRAGGTWVLRSPGGGTFRTFTFGTAKGDVPVVGDWDGDGDDEPGIYRKGGLWFLRRSTATSSTQLPSFAFGLGAADRPVVGDWTGDSTSAPGIFRASAWYLRAGTAPSDPIASTIYYGN